jgi:hypothetical protein
MVYIQAHKAKENRLLQSRCEMSLFSGFVRNKIDSPNPIEFADGNEERENSAVHLDHEYFQQSNGLFLRAQFFESEPTGWKRFFLGFPTYCRRHAHL